jgi:hypothetical protein
MNTLILIIILIEVVLSLYKPLYGFCFLLAVRLLIPDNTRSILLPISLNSIVSILLFIGWIFNIAIGKISVKGLKNNLIKIILVLTCYSIVVILVDDYTPRMQQVLTFIQYYTLQFLPILVLMTVIQNTKDLLLIIRVFTFSLLICCIYGILCYITQMPYPYNGWFNSYFAAARGASVESAIETQMGGVSGRIMGTATSDTWSFGQLICIAFILMCCIYYKIKNPITLITSILSGIAVLLTVRRSPILTAFVFFFILFIYNNNKRKILFSMSLFVIMICILIYIVPSLSNFKSILESSLFFWNDNVAAKNDVTGSSLALREYQLNYTIQQLKYNPLLGNGWGAMYVRYNPGMFGWESYILTTLMQFGFLGLIAWSWMIWNFYEYSTIYSKDKKFARAFIIGSLALWLTSDTIYPFFIYFGCVMLNKIDKFHISKYYGKIKNKTSIN